MSKFDKITARNCYYAVTHPLQYGDDATYFDWISCIMETCKVTNAEAEKIAAEDKFNRLHSNSTITK